MQEHTVQLEHEWLEDFSRVSSSSEYHAVEYCVVTEDKVGAPRSKDSFDTR